jgi:hypothetical protein
MKTQIRLWFFSLTMGLVMVLANANDAVSQVTTNGNGGATDVGTWYEQIFPMSPPGPWDQWESAHLGMNDLPLINWTVLGGTTSSYSGTFAQYDSSNPAVIANDMAALAQAKIDFLIIDVTNGGLAGYMPAYNFSTTYADAVMAGANTWNANNSWKIRVSFAIGAWVGGSPQEPVIENQAQDVWNNYSNNATYGNPGNWYQINGKPLLVVYNYNGNASTLATYCASNDCTYINNFQIEFANSQGAGQWGWQLPHSGTVYDPTGLVEQVSPGWIYYNAMTWNPSVRNDGQYYQNNWDVVFNNPHPRIVVITSYNDWIEQQGFFVNNTMSPQYIPSPPWNVWQYNARLPEVWTLPDDNVTLDGYWRYTLAAINYLRNGGTRPAWPQPAPNLAPTASVTASSTYNSSWAASNAADGNPGTAWSTQYHGSANNTEWIQLHMPGNPTFNTVVLMGRNDVPYCFPVDFQIQVWNGSTWLTRVQETGFPQPAIPGTPVAFTWGFSDTTTDVRILATKLGPDQFGNYYMQLGEFEVLNEGSTATAPFFANWGFESPAGNYTYGPFTNGWTFNSTAGVQMSNSAWRSYMPPQGVQSAFVQDNTGSFSQQVVFPAGTYDIRFLAAQRSGYASQTFAVYFDSTLIATVTPPTTDEFTPYVTNTFTSSGGPHTITFNGTAANGNGFIDAVQIFNASAIGSNLLADPSWASGNLNSWGIAGTHSAAYLSAGGGYNNDPYVLNENSTTGSFNVVAYQDFTATPGHQFTASVYAQTSASASGSSYVGGQDGGSGSYPYLCATAIPAGTSSWTLFSCTGTVPPDGKVRMLLSSGPQPANGWTKFDNASLIVQ